MSKLLPSSERGRWTLAVVAGCLAMVAINLWWVATYRHGYPLNIDEAGYTAIGVVDYFGLRDGGLSGWWDAIQQQAPNAPLVSALASLGLKFSSGIMPGFAVLIAFGALLTLATYGVAERLAGPRLGALAALAVATSEGAILFSREYIFALPTAALLTSAVYAGMRSEGLARRRWAIACGALLGLMLLTRTMAVAFIPGVLVAVVVTGLVRGREDLAKKALSLALAALAGVAVAATWYWRNLQPVLDYLTSFGYGNQAEAYGADNPLLSWDRLRTTAQKIADIDLLAPMTVIVAVGLIALAVVLVQRLRGAENRRAELLHIAGSDAFAMLLVVLAGYAALTSSQNGGNGFTLPLAMLLPVLAVLALRYHRAALVPVAVLVALVGALNLVSTSTLWADAAKPREVLVPGLGEVDWINGVPRPVSGIRGQVAGPEARFDAGDAAWLDLDSELATLFLEPTGPKAEQPIVVFGTRSPILNTNTVDLASLFDHNRGFYYAQILAEPDDSVANYESQLEAQAWGPPLLLLTMSSNAGDYAPIPTQSKVEAAARRQGFTIARRQQLPDGRELRIWTNSPPLRPPAP